MLEPRMSPATRAWLERLRALPINPTDRALARTEFLRAEASAEKVVSMMARVRHAVMAMRKIFAVRRQRLG